MLVSKHSFVCFFLKQVQWVSWMSNSKHMNIFNFSSSNLLISNHWWISHCKINISYVLIFNRYNILSAGRCEVSMFVIDLNMMFRLDFIHLCQRLILYIWLASICLSINCNLIKTKMRYNLKYLCKTFKYKTESNYLL